MVKISSTFWQLAFTVAIGIQANNFLTGLMALHHYSFLLFCISISVPHDVIVESVTARGTVTTNVVHILINNVSS